MKTSKMALICLSVASLVAASGLPVSAVAAKTPPHWTMTEVQAERFVKRVVKYTDRRALANFNADVADAKAYLQETKAAFDAVGGVDGERTADWWNARNAYVDAQQQYNTIASAGCGCVYRAVDADCRGASPSTDAYHFSVFRCRALLGQSVPGEGTTYAGWARGVVRVVTRSTATWSWAG